MLSSLMSRNINSHLFLFSHVYSLNEFYWTRYAEAESIIAPKTAPGNFSTLETTLLE